MSRDPDGFPFLWSEELLPQFERFKAHIQNAINQHNIPPNNRLCPAETFFAIDHVGPPVEKMVRQAEALFNLSQLMFALYHGSCKEMGKILICLTACGINSPIWTT